MRDHICFELKERPDVPLMEQWKDRDSNWVEMKLKKEGIL